MRVHGQHAGHSRERLYKADDEPAGRFVSLSPACTSSGFPTAQPLCLPTSGGMPGGPRHTLGSSTWLTTLHRFGTQRSPHGRMHARSRHVSQSPLGFPYRPAGCAVRLYAAGRCSLLPCRAVFESSNFADKKLTYIIVLLIIICLSGRLGKITHH